MSDDLLPCPFCGGEAYLRDDVSHSTAYFVGCSTKDCFGEIHWGQTAEETIAAWNRRTVTLPDDVTKAVEALTSLPAVYAHQINTGVREVYDPLQRFYTMESVLSAVTEATIRNSQTVPVVKECLTADVAKAVEEAGKVVEGVTPGPWTVEHKHGTTRLMMGDDCQMCDETYYPWVPGNEKDWHFIAWCREGVPALIAIVTAQAARIEAVEAERDRQYDENVNRVNQQALAENRAETAEAKVKEMAAQIAELEAEVAKVTSDRAYIIGANAGWEAAVEQGEATPASIAVFNRAEAAETALAAEREKNARLVEAGNRVLAWSDRQGGHGIPVDAENQLRAAITEAGR